MLSTAVTPGVLPRPLGSRVRGWALPVVVLLLTVGVIGMHSLGATHHVPVSAAMTTADMPITASEPALAHTKHRVELRVGFVAQIAMSAGHTGSTGPTPASECATCPGVHANRGDHGRVDRTASSVDRTASGVDRTVTLGAVMQGAVMQGAVMEGAVMEGAVMEGAVMEGAVMEGAVMEGAVMEGAVMGGHGLMGMCLAVLPLLALVLHRAHRGWFRLTPQRIHVPLLAGSGVRWGPTPITAVSLTRLCIRRT